MNLLKKIGIAIGLLIVFWSALSIYFLIVSDLLGNEDIYKLSIYYWIELIIEYYGRLNM